ncbi:hypothetical protein FGIG_10886, partial [Fasciola gigantica]
ISSQVIQQPFDLFISLWIFYRNLKVTINTVHQNNLVVFANVVHVSLLIDPPVLNLTAEGIGYGWVADSGIRGHVTLHNPFHAPARFAWKSCDQDNAFTIRPVRGTALYYLLSRLSGSSKQHFRLLVHEKVPAPSNMVARRRESQQATEPDMLICTVKMPQCKLIFSLRRLTLGQIAYRLPCKRSVRVSNLGLGPAFFRIEAEANQDDTLTARPGSIISRGTTKTSAVPVNILVSPYEGEVPVGGHVDLQITAVPLRMGKFEAALRLITHDSHASLMAVCGTVIPHEVTLHSMMSDFGGVCVTGQSELSFGLSNTGNTEALVEIDLREHPEFQIVPESHPIGRSSTHSSIRHNSTLFTWSNETSETPSRMDHRKLVDGALGDQICRILVTKKSQWHGVIRFCPKDASNTFRFYLVGKSSETIVVYFVFNCLLFAIIFNLKILVNKTPLGHTSSSETPSDLNSLEHNIDRNQMGKTSHRVLAIGLVRHVRCWNQITGKLRSTVLWTILGPRWMALFRRWSKWPWQFLI